MAPATRRRTANGGERQAASDGEDATARGRGRRSSTTAATKTTPTTTTTPASPHLTVAEAADARELEELGGIDPATSFLYTPHTITGLLIGIALLIYYTGAFSAYTGGGDDPAAAAAAEGGGGGRRGLVAALATWLLYCLLQGSPRMPLLRPHPAVWRLVHGAAVAYLLALVWLLCQTAAGARGALALLYPELGRPLPERSYGGDCGLFRRKAAVAAAAAAAAASDAVSSSPAASPLSSSFFSASFSSVSSSLLALPSCWPYELNLQAVKSTLLDEFVVAHTLGWWAKAVLLRDRRLLWPLSVGFELAEASLAHALPNFSECWWDSWVLDVAVCNLAGMELGMATAALLRARERARQEKYGGSGGSGGESGSGGGFDAWGGVSTKRGALAKARRVAAQFSPRSWEERDWNPGGSPRRAGWALFLVAAFLLFDLNSFFLKAALWVPQLNPLTLYRLVGFFLLGLPAFQEFYRFVVAGEEQRRAAAEARARRLEEEEEKKKKKKKKGESESGLAPPSPLPAANRLGPCAWLMLAIIAAETLVAVKFGPSLLGSGGGGGGGGSSAGGEGGSLRLLPRSAVRALGVFGAAAAGLAGTWLWSGLREEEERGRRRRRGG